MTQLTFALSGLVLDNDGQPREATVYLSGGQIARVAPGRAPGADLVTPGIIAPGLIDLQVNGAYGYDFTLDPASAAAVAEKLPASGVTGFLPTLITSEFATYPARLRAVAAVMAAQRAVAQEAARPAGARVLGVHLEGPYMNPARKGAHPPACIRPVDVAEIRAWADPAVTRIVTLAPELPGALDAARVLRAAGMVVSAGHSDATYAQAAAGFAAGFNWGTHLYNAMRPLGHREPGLMGALLTHPVPCGLIADGIHSHPAMLQLAWQSKGAAGITLVTDCMAAMGMAPGRYQLGEHAVIVDDTSARLDDGTLAGSILTLDAAVRNMLAFTGCGLPAALAMASTTPARLLGLDHRLAPGCPADLVVLSEDHQVQQTLIGGQVVYAR